MHASVALCLMFFCGPIAPSPDPNIINFNLNPNLDPPTAMQELEWRTRVRYGHYKLPRLPTVDDERPSDRTSGRKVASQTDPNAQRRQQQAMPFAPTDPGAMGQNGTTANVGPMPSMPGSGMNQGGGQSFTQNGTGRYDPYATDNQLSKPVSGNYGYGGGATSAPRAAYTPTASDTMSGIMSRSYLGTSGISPNPMLNASPGGGDKPFAGYQRPSGYSPWMRLYDTPTNGGTVSPYSQAVQPALQQQQYNQQMAERIEGVRNGMVGPRSGTPGMESPVNGAGLNNPYGSINYVNPMGR